MNKYLLKKNNELESTSFNNENINDFLLDFIECDDKDDIANIILHYQTSEKGKFFLTDNEYAVITKELEYDYHILIKIILHYFIACSSQKNQSQLVNYCKEYINKFFLDTENNYGNIRIYNLCTVIEWTIIKFPEFKKDISKFLFNKIINEELDVIKVFALTNHFLSNDDLIKIFNSSQYEFIYNKYFIKTTNFEYIYFYLDTYERYYEYISENKYCNKKSFSKKYCDFVLKNIDLIDNRTKQVLLQKIKNIMNDLKIFDEKKYIFIQEHLEIANKEVLSTLVQFNLYLNEEQVNSLMANIKNQNELFSKLTNVEKIVILLYELNPISIEQMEEQISKNKGLAINFFEKRVIDCDGRVINYKKLSDKELFSLESNEYIQCDINLKFDLLINPFFKNVVVDKELEDYIKKIMTNNKMVSDDRIEYLTKKFLIFLNEDFESSINHIVEELEESLRYYFKKSGIYIYKKNRNNDLIGLTSIFNDNEKNIYREKLLETIDEDYYFTLKWFLTDNYGFGLKNKISHRYQSKNLLKKTYSIYIAFMILKLYWRNQL